jgi:very-short-patch-repair endonuclease
MPHYPPKKPNYTDRARLLRRSMTEAEVVLWRHLRGQVLGVGFRRQEQIGLYIVDFVCYQCKVIVEADGQHHADNPNDAVRDCWLADRGFLVLRFWNQQIIQNTQAIVAEIQAAVLARESLAPAAGEAK